MNSPSDAKDMASASSQATAPQTVWRDLRALVAAAALYRLLLVWAVPPVVDSADALRYLEASKQIMSGEFDVSTSRIPPLYPALTVMLSWIGLSLESAARAVSLAASIALVAPVYLLALRMHGRRTAVIAGVVVAIWPWLADWGTRVAPEALAVLFWFSALVLLARGAGNSWASLCAGIAALFLLHLTRPEGLFLLLAAPIICFVFAGPRNSRWRKTALCGVLAIGMLAVQALLARTTGGAASVTARADVRGTLQYTFINRGSALVDTFGEVISHNLPVMLGPLFLLLAGVGLLAPRGERSLRTELAVLLFAGFQIALAILSTWPEPRYVMAPVIALSIWSARGIADTGLRISEAGYRRWRSVPLVVVVGMMGLGTLSMVVPEFTGRMPRAPREYQIAGEWLKAHGEPGLIVCRKPQVGYYADMPSTGPVDYPTLERFLVWMDAIDAKYLVVDERYTAQMVDVVRPLLDPKNAPPELRLLTADLSPYADARLVIYKLMIDRE